MTEDVREWAERYAELGWHVFPVREDKTPATPNGWHDATSDPGDHDWTGCGIGVASRPSNLLVLDVDVKKRDDGTIKNGLLWLEAMEAEWEDVPRDVEARTPSGGQHIFFRAPPGSPIQLVGTNGFPDVDLIGNGYAVVEPSRGPGGEYFWMDDASPWDAEVPPCPAWLLELVNRYTRERPGGTASRGGTRVSRRDALASDDKERARFESALGSLDPDMLRSPWLRAMMAVHAKTGGSELGFRMFEEWSKQSPKYDARHIRRDWLSLDPWAEVQPGTLFSMASEAGWDERMFKRSWSIREAREESPEWGELYEAALEELAEHLGIDAVSARPRRVGNGADLLAMEFPRTDWLVSGVLTASSVFVVGGEPKTSKTWAGLELLISMLTGIKAFGAFPARRTDLPVFAFLAEDQERSLRNRLRSLSAGKSCDPQPWAGRFRYQSLEQLDLGSPESLASLVADVRFAAPDGISVLYLDPLRDLHTGEENDSGDMAQVMGRLRALRSVLDCAVVFVHHTHKASRDTKGRRAAQTLRGSSAIHGAVDGGLYLHSVEPDDTGRRWKNRVEVELKAVRGAGAFNLTLELDDDDQGEAIAARWYVDREPPQLAGANGVRAAHAIERVRAAAAEHGPATVTEITRAAGVNRRTAAKHLAELVRQGLLFVDDAKRYSVPCGDHE